MKKSRTERHLSATEELIEKKAAEADEILKAAENEDREPTEKEEERISEISREVKTLREKRDEYSAMLDTEREIRQVSTDLGKAESVDVAVKNEPPRHKSLGEQFTDSKQYQELVENGFGGANWKMRPVELSTKATLVTTPGTALTPASYTPGIVEELFQPPTVADLMPSAQAQSSVIRYVQETAGTAGLVNGADTVEEADTKPESKLAFEEVSDDVRKIATVLPVSDEMLEDAAQIQGYINQRLSLFVRLKEDEQLLSGNGTSPNISGLLDRNINVYGAGTVDSNAVAIFKAANGTRGSAFLSPDAIVMNPEDWQNTRLEADDNGQFFGGGPFYGPYGGPQGPASANRFSADNIWGLNVVVTSAIGAGTALVGAFRTAAQVYRKGGLTVDATNSHEDFFYRNLTAIRAEERLALAVYRPQAFTKITGL